MNTDMITYKELKEAVIVIELYMQQLQEGLKRVEAYNSTKLATLIGENDFKHLCLAQVKNQKAPCFKIYSTESQKACLDSVK